MRTLMEFGRLTICCTLLALAPSIVRAATLTVTTLVDTDDSVCDSSCSLRDAIVAATPGDTIVFAPELRGGNIQLTKTLLIDKRITIDGPNVRRISLSGNQTFRVLHIRIPTGSRVVMLDGLIIRNGGAADGDGGGILLDSDFQATINMTNCAVLDNSAQRGGGVFMNFGILFVVDSTIANNTATGNGSAGGIETFQGTLQIINSTISGNRSLGTADGVGGIRFTGSPNWRIIGSTIAFNSTNGTAGSTSAGGIAGLNGAPGPIWNTIIAKNTGIKPDLTGRIGGAANSFIGVADESLGLPNGVNGNIVGTPETPVDPLLLPLADNGGSILTHALASKSRAINAGNNTLALDRMFNPETKDQRRYTRIANETVDIGSFESNSQPLSYLSTITGRVTRSDGRGVSGAHITVRAPNGNTYFGISNPFGYYRVVNIPPTAMYSIQFRHKSFSFIQNEILIEEFVEYLSAVLE